MYGTGGVAGAGEGYLDHDAFRSAALDAGKDILDRTAADARRARIDAETLLVKDVRRDPSAAIVAAAKRWRADLIVMGTQRRTGLERLLMGSVAEGVARATPVPVLLVRGGAARKRPTRRAVRRA